MAAKKTIKLAIDFWHNPKTLLTIRKLGIDAVRSLQIFWCHAVQKYPSGNLGKISEEAFEAASDWQGEPGAFFALCKAVWLDLKDDGTWSIHDWDDFNMSAEAKRTLKEKNSSPALLTPSSIELPVLNAAPSPIYEEEIQQWQKAYPAVNVPQEIKKMFVWLEANPSRQKTLAGLRRFIVSWLAREQNNGGNVHGRRNYAPSVFQSRMEQRDEMAQMLVDWNNF